MLAHVFSAHHAAFLGLVGSLLLSCALALPNGLGVTPPMGYNTWNDFRCNDISASNVKKVADAMAANGLARAGYRYLNIDDCWAVRREPETMRIVADPAAFPEGIKPVADYVHGKGLLFGIYTDRGNATCAGRPGSRGFEGLDAATYASWGVDYLKEDSCWADSGHQDVAFADYARMRDALNATGRPIYFSLCGWYPWYSSVGNTLGNSWRIWGDVNGWGSVYTAAQVNAKLFPNAGPGGWNDPDMLVGSSPHAAVYNSPEQSRTQFSLWAAMSAPLLIGSNVLNMSTWDLETYTNAEMIAVNQDALGKQAAIVHDTCPKLKLSSIKPRHSVDFNPKRPSDELDADVPECEQVWAKPMSDGSVVLVLVNWNGSARNVTCASSCLRSAGIDASHVLAYDLWEHRKLGVFSSVVAQLGANGASASIRVKAASSSSSSASSSLASLRQNRRAAAGMDTVSLS
ncbi:hypothetical protein PPROV_000082000 [Pycnococcus provasolii]|uniref:Alpha-galactosidase n=1 Tax=Pycnococcus provasolii TaxID=41880 RepID=A0A830H4V0_9CHLO|nr:hypothetical protein PPROV_000082000 [Pycnococcus provasolii]|mmetsp:Transcript_2206/g.5940  ORF Transcript_2206/g.5940 Transcript_2206/m.5940 type:complete len:459 (-) Transcript_2206:25-1401(-)